MTHNMPINVLVVDDEAYVREVLSRWLRQEGYDVETAVDAGDALHALGRGAFQLVLLDVGLPGESGLDLLPRLREKFPDVAVMMVTAERNRAAAHQAMELGAQAYLTKPFNQDDVLINVDGALQKHRLMRDAEVLQKAELGGRANQVRQREEEIALRLVAAAEYCDEDPSQHVRRVGMFSEALARALGWDSAAADDIRIAAAMHDIGKIGVPDGILLKARKLTDAEFEVVKLHTTIGAEMLAGSTIPLLQMAHDIALSHHENWDGSGYPQALRGKKIKESARIVAVADVFDSLTHVRAYRAAYTFEEALAIMRKECGTRFDPEVFDVFLEQIPVFQRIEAQVTETIAVAGADTQGTTATGEWFVSLAAADTRAREEVAAQ